MPLYLIILFTFLAVYFSVGSIFLSILRSFWYDSCHHRYLELIEIFRKNPWFAVKFGLTWPLTFTHLLLHFIGGKDSTFKEKFMGAAADHAEEVLNIVVDDD